MPRIKIDLPERFAFSTELSLRITDINYGGHLGNDAVLGLVHEARVRFLKHHGFSETEIGGVS
ncbi:MAG: thioesterase, partial [Proteobacteria bacterium]|nr:thioesterase [Pseudomonadota bacterium]